MGKLVIAALVAITSVPASANLLVNGDFEASSSPTTTPPGWTNIGHMDGVIAYSNFGTPAYDGLEYYDIGGYGGALPANGDGLTQTVATSLGSYVLTFGYSGENTAGVSTVLDVNIGGTMHLFTIVATNSGLFKNPFTTASINYTATGPSTVISFTQPSSTMPGFNDVLLDKIDFSAGASGTPEPASWAMFIIGFGLVGLIGRRSRPVVA